MEIWKKIPNYNLPEYEVSNLGRVKKLEHSITSKIGRKRIYPERILFPDANFLKKYKKNLVTLMKDGKQEAHTVSKLVLSTFNGYSDKKHIKFLDGNTLNDKLDNLAWSEYVQGITKSDVVGKKYGILTVESMAGHDEKGRIICNVVCECGVRKTMHKSNLKRCISCGCINKKLTSERTKTHGCSQCGDGEYKREFAIWSGIKTRCNNPNRKCYYLYGGRGISICNRWSNSFENFIEDMGPAPTDEHSIDRIDCNGNYCPENCRWATWNEQGLNRRDNRIIEFDGRSQCLIEWSRETGISNHTIHARLKLGWTIEKTLTTPVLKTYDEQLKDIPNEIVKEIVEQYNAGATKISLCNKYNISKKLMYKLILEKNNAV